MSNLGKLKNYLNIYSKELDDIYEQQINYLRQMPSGTADKILSGQMKLPTGVDLLSWSFSLGEKFRRTRSLDKSNLYTDGQSGRS